MPDIPSARQSNLPPELESPSVSPVRSKSGRKWFFSFISFLVILTATAGAIWFGSLRESAVDTCTELGELAQAESSFDHYTFRGLRCYLHFPDGRIETIYLR